jgi:high-affinity nickel-transport protein
MSSTALGIVLGTAVGLRHAFEPDHLTAVSTLVNETHTPWTGARLGVLWGLGHTISLVVVGTILALVGATLPPRAAVGFELGVALMLLVLGARAIAVAMRIEAQAVRADAEATHSHVHGGRSRWRPLVVGLIHGLAGSGALSALVFAQMPGTGARVLYMTLFGLGSIVGMAIASGVAGTAIQHLVRSSRARRRLGVATGVLSIIVGLVWGIPLLVSSG